MSPKKKGAQPRVKHQPQRTCIACREVGDKRALVRIVRTPDGRVEPDPTGKKSGRGAYVHATGECIERALSGGILARALKTQIDSEAREQLASALGTRTTPS